MMTASQITAVRDWIAAALAEAAAAAEPEIFAAIPLGRIVYTDQDHPAPALPYITYNVIADPTIGTAGRYARGDHGASQVITRQQAASTISIRITTRRDDAAPDPLQDARHYANALHLRTESEVSSILGAALLAFRGATLQPNLALEQSGRRVQRSGIDITFGVARLIADAPGTIQTAEVTGTTTPPTPDDPLLATGT